jgi:hypothetical protein
MPNEGIHDPQRAYLDHFDKPHPPKCKFWKGGVRGRAGIVGGGGCQRTQNGALPKTHGQQNNKIVVMTMSKPQFLLFVF